MLVKSQISNPNFQTNLKSQFPNFKPTVCNLFVICYLVLGISSLFAQEGKLEPIIVNGDIVEYSTEAREVTATGNVIVNYKDTKLTCEKLTVNTLTKDAQAEGNVRIEDEKGVIKGSKVIYNFDTKKGIIIDSEFMSNPYFGKSDKAKRVSETEFVGIDGYVTTCNLDHPHYRIRSKKVNFFPHDKIQTKHDTFYVGRLPILYLPRYNHSLKDPLMHVQFSPGRRKEWGSYLLSATRYNLAENASGRIYLDWREKLGIAEGFGLNYAAGRFGKGDFKYYYTQERSRRFREGEPAEFQRYFIRWRHQWDIDERTNLTSEYYKIVDSKRILWGSQYNILKDYFFREYEKDAQPLSYTLLHRNFNYSSMDLIFQKRINRWYSQLEKLPEIKYSLPGFKIGETPFYFGNSSSAANFNYKYAVPSSSTNDINMFRFDTYNKISLPTKLAFSSLTPFVASRETFYDKDIYGSSISPRTVFYTGLDTSTKFYRIFNVKSNFLGMDINGLRHIVTPTIKYSYNHEPTILNTKLKQIDSLDSITRSNSASLELSNKLQTKRNNKTVDFANLKVSSTYTFKPKGGRGSNFSDFLFDLELMPYSWLRVEADTTYDHFQDRFKTANLDLCANFGEERTVGMGHRYERKGGKEFIGQLIWRLSPKWKFGVYERYQFATIKKKGLKEQEYFISRDLHCWTVELTYNVTREKGETIWLVFRLKAFPEMEFGFNQSYHEPKAGSQSE